MVVCAVAELKKELQSRLDSIDNDEKQWAVSLEQVSLTPSSLWVMVCSEK